MKERIIGRAAVSIVRKSRRFRHIIVTGSGVPSQFNVPTSQAPERFAAICRTVRAEQSRAGGTSNWVKGFKGRPILGNTTGIAGRARKGAPRAVNLGSF